MKFSPTLERTKTVKVLQKSPEILRFASLQTWWFCEIAISNLEIGPKSRNFTQKQLQSLNFHRLYQNPKLLTFPSPTKTSNFDKFRFFKIRFFYPKLGVNVKLSPFLGSASPKSYTVFIVYTQRFKCGYFRWIPY